MAKNFKSYGVKRTGISNGAPDSIEIHSIGCAQDEALKIFDNMNVYSPDGIVNAIVDASTDYTVYEILPDTNITWADKGYGNDHSFTIEVAESDYMRYRPDSASYDITDKTRFIQDVRRGYNTYVLYVAKKCIQFGLYPLDKLPNGLYKVYSHAEAAKKGLASNHADPTHLWCQIGKTMDDFRKDVAVAMKDDVEVAPVSYTPGMSKEEFIEVVGRIANRLYSKYGFLASVVAAQAILESGFGRGADAIELTKRNNIIGMKSELINTTWKMYSVWPGESYRKKTPEVYNGKKTYIYDNFRVYDSFDQCLEDYCLFLTYVKNDLGLKYADLAWTRDPRTLISGISRRGYATDPSYVTKIMKIIDENNLTRFDTGSYSGGVIINPDKYVVRESFDNPGSQTNSFNNLDYAKAEADRYGYNVYEAANGNLVYGGRKKEDPKPAKKRKFVGKVTASMLNVRSGAGTNYPNIANWPYLLRNNLIDVYDTVKDSSGNNWYYVRIAGKYYGYVYSAYVEKA